MHYQKTPGQGIRLLSHLLIGGLWLLLSTTATASDLMREQRIAEQIEEAILVGEPIRLQAGEVSFLAIHSEAERAPVKGAVIILHGRGAHPDWMEVVQPLRTELPDAGWETLSLQLPVAPADAPGGSYRSLIPEAFPRIEAAIDYLQQRDIDFIVLLGHSLGARMAVAYLAQAQQQAIGALVTVGLLLPAGRGRNDTLSALQTLTLPMLDIYGSRDLDSVLRSAKLRAAAARRAGNRDYSQLQIEGADHFFRDNEADLVARVRGWIDRMASRAAAEKSAPENSPPPTE